ncbi:hypothetical protein KFE25_010111 [Diacronema lutheri]|uniref:S1-like domain-containing protein n=2 Tax=Diacronema lutheri TaxID=2081491 RepID=A0A8J5XI22_DIALT|nr:hypothetical protein KFE25_010111 [Diacronema lutheri]
MATRQLLQRQVLRADPFPVPEGAQRVAKVVAITGGNAIEVHVAGMADADATVHARLPSKFKKAAWFRAGDYVIVDFEGDDASMASGWVVHALHKPQVKHLRDCRMWPAEFEEAAPRAFASDQGDEYLVNQNHVSIEDEDAEGEEEEESSGEVEESDERNCQR